MCAGWIMAILTFADWMASVQFFDWMATSLFHVLCESALRICLSRCVHLFHSWIPCAIYHLIKIRITWQRCILYKYKNPLWRCICQKLHMFIICWTKKSSSHYLSDFFECVQEFSNTHVDQSVKKYKQTYKQSWSTYHTYVQHPWGGNSYHSRMCEPRL